MKNQSVSGNLSGENIIV